MERIFNRPATTEVRRQLRQDLPKYEAVLWSRLRNRQLGGLKFRRQVGVGPYVVDFLCSETRLVVEVDGVSHDAPGADVRDRERQAYLERSGLKVLRFMSDDVARHMEAVLEAIVVAAGGRAASG